MTHDDILRYEEILTIIQIGVDLGITKVRVTGGEPLVRRGAVEFLERLLRMPGIDDVGLTTNGTLLSSMARQLRGTGLSRLNVSLDSLRRDVFKEITGSDDLGLVLEGIEAAREQGFDPIKINVVLLKGVNEQDIPDFARMTLDSKVDVRFIERMPFGVTDAQDPPDGFAATEALSSITREFGPLEELGRLEIGSPARMFRIRGARGRIGVIEPMTGHFCGACNRMRLTAKGALRPCLMSPREIDIKEMMRNGASREQLADLIRLAVHSKPVSSLAAGSLEPTQGMNQIGG